MKPFFGMCAVHDWISWVELMVEGKQARQITNLGNADDEFAGRHAQSPLLPNIFFSISAIGPVAGSFG